MSKDQIIDSLGRIDDDVIQKVNDARNARKPKIQVRRWEAMAACFALIISMALTAEATNGTVSNLLAPLFGGAQTEIVDKIGVPIGASASVNGYTLTADAIIGDRYSVMIAYTLSRDDGQPIPENIDFEDRGMMASGYSTRIEIDEEDPSIARFHERWRLDVPIIGRIVSPAFTNLIIDNGEDDTLLVEGVWELTFTFRYPDTTEKLPVKSFEVTDDGGNRYKVKKMMLSPVGVHLDLVFYNPHHEGGIFKDFTISLIMADGTEMSLTTGGGGGGWAMGDTEANISYYANFNIPIPRDDIKAIVICGTTYELSNS